MDIPTTLQSALEQLQSGNLEQAESLYKTILEEHPDNSRALHFLGLIYFHYKNYALAAEYIKKALRINPDYVDAYNNLGIILQEKGNLDEAIACYQKALHLNPAFANAYYNLGNAFREKRLPDEAIACYQKAIDFNLNFAGVFYYMGTLLHGKKRFDEALSCFQKALQIAPFHSDTHNNIGSILLDMKQLDEAEAAFRKALEINPESAFALNNLGTVLREKGRLDEAICFYQKALGLDPDFVGAYCNLGVIYQEKGMIDDALRCYQKAIALNPDYVDAHWNMSFALLLSGNYREGWKEYEWRRKKEDCFYYQRSFPRPLWDGSDIAGSTILLTAEQGFGDALQFVRYAPLLARRGAKIILECLRELKPLMQRVDGIEQVIMYAHDLPQFDFHCPLLSLPYFFNTTVETIPADIPYISTDPKLVGKWYVKVCNDNARLKIGIVWAGGFPPQKSCSFELFSALLQENGLAFYSLQKGPASDQAKKRPSSLNFFDYTDEISDFSDTAAFIQNLDLIISVDTAVAHLAGALGKPVWTLLPFAPDWRWLLDRDDSPWYPTMRLFRQSSPGEWAPVIARIRTELHRLMVQ